MPRVLLCPSHNSQKSFLSLSNGLYIEGADEKSNRSFLDISNFFKDLKERKAVEIHSDVLDFIRNNLPGNEEIKNNRLLSERLTRIAGRLGLKIHVSLLEILYVLMTLASYYFWYYKPYSISRVRYYCFPSAPGGCSTGKPLRSPMLRLDNNSRIRSLEKNYLLL